MASYRSYASISLVLLILISTFISINNCAVSCTDIKPSATKSKLNSLQLILKSSTSRSINNNLIIKKNQEPKSETKKQLAPTPGSNNKIFNGQKDDRYVFII